MPSKEEIESPVEDKEIDPERAIEHVRKNRQKAKDFAEKIRNGYIPEKRLKDEIVEKIYDTLTGSHDKPSYDDLLELRNYLLSDGKTDSVEGRAQDKSEDDKKPEKSEAVMVDDRARNKNTGKLKDSNSPASIPSTDHAGSDPEVEGKDYFMHDFHEPLGSVMFCKNRTCVNEEGDIIGLWNEDGKIHDPSGKQIGHLPSTETDRFNDFLEALGIRDKDNSKWNYRFSFHW